MRNFIWSGAAMVGLTAAGMFMGAQHAAHYPNSFVGRCAMRVYQLCDPLFVPRPEEKQARLLLPAPQAALEPAPIPDVIEPIVVVPTEDEPPIALPRLAPEIIAAIERLRNEEESEAPPQPFDSPGRAQRMPYADEPEVLPMPARAFSADFVSIYPPAHFCLIPSSCWQLIFERLLGPAQD